MQCSHAVSKSWSRRAVLTNIFQIKWLQIHINNELVLEYNTISAVENILTLVQYNINKHEKVI